MLNEGGSKKEKKRDRNVPRMVIEGKQCIQRRLDKTKYVFFPCTRFSAAEAPKTKRKTLRVPIISNLFKQIEGCSSFN